MPTYQFSIITPQGKIFDDSVDALTAPGTEGSFGVLAKHTPMVVALKNGVLSIKQNNVEKIFAVKSGVLEVSHENNVLLLSDEAVLMKDKEEAQEKVKNFS